MTDDAKFGVLFVCLGNICRSPLAEGVFRHALERSPLRGLVHVDSCGTGGWHIGAPAHPGSMDIAEKNGISLREHRARQLTQDDFRSFHLLVAMDRANVRDIKRVGQGYEFELALLRDFDPLQGDGEVPDPYYLESKAYDDVFQICARATPNLLAAVQDRLGKSS